MGLLSPWEEHSEAFSFHACDCCRTQVWIPYQHSVVITYSEILQISNIEVLAEVKR